jgi:hypothetical protein
MPANWWLWQAKFSRSADGGLQPRGRRAVQPSSAHLLEQPKKLRRVGGRQYRLLAAAGDNRRD